LPCTIRAGGGADRPYAAPLEILDPLCEKPHEGPDECGQEKHDRARLCGDNVCTFDAILPCAAARAVHDDRRHGRRHSKVKEQYRELPAVVRVLYFISRRAAIHRAKPQLATFEGEHCYRDRQEPDSYRGQHQRDRTGVLTIRVAGARVEWTAALRADPRDPFEAVPTPEAIHSSSFRPAGPHLRGRGGRFFRYVRARPPAPARSGGRGNCIWWLPACSRPRRRGSAPEGGRAGGTPEALRSTPQVPRRQRTKGLRVRRWLRAFLRSPEDPRLSLAEFQRSSGERRWRVEGLRRSLEELRWPTEEFRRPTEELQRSLKEFRWPQKLLPWVRRSSLRVRRSAPSGDNGAGLRALAALS
jgi:hypothetical protein